MKICVKRKSSSNNATHILVQRFVGNTSEYVLSDVIVRQTKNDWQVILKNDVVPKLRLNALYANILKQSKNEGTLDLQLQEAKWLIKNMHQRFDTILRVVQAIVERQRNFFSHGAFAMGPLVLREIADTLELHESTISRVTTQKYIPHGMYFFGSHVATEAGGEASSTAIQALIKNSWEQKILKVLSLTARLPTCSRNKVWW